MFIFLFFLETFSGSTLSPKITVSHFIDHKLSIDDI